MECLARMAGTTTYTAQIPVVCWTEHCGGKPSFFDESAEVIVAFNFSQANGG